MELIQIIETRRTLESRLDDIERMYSERGDDASAEASSNLDQRRREGVVGAFAFNWRVHTRHGTSLIGAGQVHAMLCFCMPIRTNYRND